MVGPVRRYTVPDPEEFTGGSAFLACPHCAGPVSVEAAVEAAILEFAGLAHLAVMRDGVTLDELARVFDDVALRAQELLGQPHHTRWSLRGLNEFARGRPRAQEQPTEPEEECPSPT